MPQSMMSNEVDSLRIEVNRSYGTTSHARQVVVATRKYHAEAGVAHMEACKHEPQPGATAALRRC
jgi:hypothetical protein